jgi:hypothetical protein
LAPPKSEKRLLAKPGSFPRIAFPVIEGLANAAAALGCPVGVAKAAKAAGSTAFLTGSRVDTRILSRDCWAKIADETGMALDLKTELAQKAREETRAKKRENDLADGLIHRLEDIEEVIWEHGLMPLRAELLAFDRKYNQAAQRGEPVDGKELARDFSQIMGRLRDALPSDRKETKATPARESGQNDYEKK